MYRQPQLATVTTWSVERTAPGVYRLSPEKVERKVVIVRGTETDFALNHGRDDVTASIEFDSDGLPTKIGIDRADANVKRAQAIGSIPALAKDAYSAGASVTQPWTTADRAAEMKAQVELLENQRKLAKLTGPVEAPNPQLKELEDAELRARIAAAQAIIDEPTRSLYLLRSVDAD